MRVVDKPDHVGLLDARAINARHPHAAEAEGRDLKISKISVFHHLLP